MSRLYKKVFEKNAEGLLSGEGFLQITHEYDVEQLALKAKIPQLREQIAEAERQAANKDKFIAAIRKFMQMDELTAPLLRELIDHIEVYETQGVGKVEHSASQFTTALWGTSTHPGRASDKPLYLRNKAGRGRGIYPRITKESRRNACSPKEA